MMTLLSGHLQGQRGEDVLDINMPTVHQRRESNRPTPGFRHKLTFRGFSQKHPSGRKDFLPVEPQGGLSFLFRLSETQVRLKSLLYLVWLRPDPFRTHGR